MSDSQSGFVQPVIVAACEHYPMLQAYPSGWKCAQCEAIPPTHEVSHIDMVTKTITFRGITK